MLEDQEIQNKESPPFKRPRYQETPSYGGTNFKFNRNIGSSTVPKVVCGTEEGSLKDLRQYPLFVLALRGTHSVPGVNETIWATVFRVSNISSRQNMSSKEGVSNPTQTPKCGTWDWNTSSRHCHIFRTVRYFQMAIQHTQTAMTQSSV